MRAAKRRVGCATALGLLLGAGAGAAPAPLPSGRYEAELCVATGDGTPACGPARAEVGAAGLVRVTVSDLVYRLRLRPADLDVTLMHGRMQVDGFSAPLAWDGAHLRFADAEKGTRYEIRFGRREH